MEEIPGMINETQGGLKLDGVTKTKKRENTFVRHFPSNLKTINPAQIYIYFYFQNKFFPEKKEEFS